KLPLAEVSKSFTGVALELVPRAGMEPAAPVPRVRMRALLGRMIGLRTALGRVFSVALAIEVFTALAPLYMQWVIDDALVAADRDLLTMLAIAFGVLLLLRAAFSATRGLMLVAIGASVRVQGRANLFAHL